MYVLPVIYKIMAAIFAWGFVPWNQVTFDFFFFFGKFSILYGQFLTLYWIKVVTYDKTRNALDQGYLSVYSEFFN